MQLTHPHFTHTFKCSQKYHKYTKTACKSTRDTKRFHRRADRSFYYGIFQHLKATGMVLLTAFSKESLRGDLEGTTKTWHDCYHIKGAVPSFWFQPFKGNTNLFPINPWLRNIHIYTQITNQSSIINLLCLLSAGNLTSPSTIWT